MGKQERTGGKVKDNSGLVLDRQGRKIGSESVPIVKYITSTAEPMQVLKLAAGECYQKEATDKVIDRIVKAGHLSVLEHCSATFEIRCSLAVLLQLTRHRHFSFTVQSSRGSELEGIYQHENMQIKGQASMMMNEYRAAIKSGIPYEDAAYILPKAVNYKLVMTGNFRAWFEYLPKRLCRRASKEHRALAEMLRLQLLDICPEVFSYAKANCDSCQEKGCRF